MVAEPFTHTAGFGGLCALASALIAFSAAWLTLRQRQRADSSALAEAQARRLEDRRNSEIERCWNRFTWILDKRESLADTIVLFLLERQTEISAQLDERELMGFAHEFTKEIFVPR